LAGGGGVHRALNDMTLTDKAFRLPTEAEWNTPAQRREKGALCRRSRHQPRGLVCRQQREFHPAVGLKASNGLGLHDMSGNVWEWCQDIYAVDIGAGSSATLVR